MMTFVFIDRTTIGSAGAATPGVGSSASCILASRGGTAVFTFVGKIGQRGCEHNFAC